MISEERKILEVRAALAGRKIIKCYGGSPPEECSEESDVLLEFAGDVVNPCKKHLHAYTNHGWEEEI